MTKTRRNFLKTAVVGSSIAVIGMSQNVSAQTVPAASSGVIKGKAPKKEITYKKTQSWEDYYKSAL